MEQLTTLRTALKKKDKEQVAGFFHFPVTDEMLVYQLQDEEKGKEEMTQIDKATFIKQYNIIGNNLQRILEKIRWNTFKETDTLLIVTENPNSTTAKCRPGYSVEILQNNMVKLSYFINDREDLPSSVKSENVACEYVEEWSFQLKDGKLIFTKLEVGP